MTSLEKLLFEFRDSHNLKGKGQLAVMLHITRLAIENGLPLNLETLRTEKEGQVAGLGKGRIQSILKDYGITRVLAEEGGRTSRGSLGNASDYSSFLNGLHKGGAVDLPSIEKWWVVRVQDYFSGKPFTLKFDPSKSLRSIVGDLLAQAKKRQDENPGTTYAGTVLQHLVGAKLDLILPEEKESPTMEPTLPTVRPHGLATLFWMMWLFTLQPPHQRRLSANARPILKQGFVLSS